MLQAQPLDFLKDFSVTGNNISEQVQKQLFPQSFVHRATESTQITRKLHSATYTIKIQICACLNCKEKKRGEKLLTQH